MKNRRQFLLKGATWIAGAIAASYVGIRVAAHNGWFYLTLNARAFERGSEPASDVEASSINFLIVGDTGKPTSQRAKVVASMRSHSSRHPAHATLLLGDNFYEDGVDSVDDPRFEQDFNELFEVSRFPMPFYVALGNHDCHQNPDAQVDYSLRNSRWRMPSRYYKETFCRNNVTVDLCVIDTSLILEQTQTSKRQLEWLRETLLQNDARWRIVAGHHPVLTGGRHRASPVIVSTLKPILDECAVDFYVSGHDHDLQLLDSQAGWRQVVSGAGSKQRSTSWIDATLFAEACPGFVSMTLSNEKAYVSYYSDNRRLITAMFSAADHSRSTLS